MSCQVRVERKVLPKFLSDTNGEKEKKISLRRRYYNDMIARINNYYVVKATIFWALKSYADCRGGSSSFPCRDIIYYIYTCQDETWLPVL